MANMAIVVAITRIFTRALPLNYNLIQSSKAAAVSKLIKQNYCSHFSPLSSLRSSSLQYCKISGIATMASLSPMDPSSFSRPEEVIVKHISLKLNVDFDTKILCGEALLTLEALGDIRDVVLDVRDLHIESVESEDGTALSYKESEALVDFGSKLTINLNKPSASHDKFNVRIKYSTSPKASALQWLEPSQTAGKLHPYMFSQCQPIHARSIMPCQDTPAVKFTYDAQISAPAQFTVLMSALRVDSQNQTSMFNQPVPIPAYLLAIAVGALQSRELGPRTLVWSEKELIDKSAWEFADTEKFLQAAEKLCGPYVWTQYDLLVLPPSFPYGGMENPCLTFVTPTLLAGDRSQADVIMHEIMHSWTGNLVTNANFEHFWLNEGWTVFLERKAAASLIQDPDEARKSRDFQSLLGLQELSEAINQLGATNPLTQLVVNLTGIHPDDAFSRVPYEKGSLFLRFLEDTVGGPAVFDEFIRHYLTTFQKQSLVTCQFQQLFQEYFQGNEKVNSIDWDLWLTSPGMPPIIPEYDTSMTLVVKELVRKLTKKKMSASEISAAAASFMPHQIIHLLQELIEKPALAINQLHELGKGLKLEQAQNSELVFRWLRLCIKSQEKSKLQAALDFVNNQGRMKYVRPIYRDLYAWKEVRQQTIDNFLANEKNMMHVSAYTVRKDLHLDSQSKVE